MNVKKIIFYLFISLILFCGCVSNPHFEGKGDLCGLVVDEKNQPVKDFVIYCSATDSKFKTISPVITNESGLFVFYDVPSGNYVLSGMKNNYLRITKTEYNFNDRSKIICLQTKTFKSAVSHADELIHLGQPNEACELLNTICCEEKSFEKTIVDLYQFYITSDDSERNLMLEKLKKNGSSEIAFLSEYVEKLEEVSK